MNLPESGLAEQLESLRAKVADLQNLYLLSQADMQNAKRRHEEEMSKVRKYAIESFADTLLPVIDSLETGLAIQGASLVQLREGMEATLRQLKAAFDKQKMTEIAPNPNSKFDPRLHQAISMIEVENQDPNTVVAVLQKGYAIADRVLRPALVTVSKNLTN
ncbi:MAG: nucleotide exchange factor GrpE [Gammaproteobacteria bacterium]|nr:nucleotide exchange factor GrpE [Gammaproteobacteria bacterium]